MKHFFEQFFWGLFWFAGYERTSIVPVFDEQRTRKSFGVVRFRRPDVGQGCLRSESNNISGNLPIFKSLTFQGIVVEIPFATFVLNHILGRVGSVNYTSLDELPSLDPELYKSLTYVKVTINTTRRQKMLLVIRWSRYSIMTVTSASWI